MVALLDSSGEGVLVGDCDCGGWDIGCPIMVLNTRPTTKEVSSRADMQGTRCLNSLYRFIKFLLLFVSIIFPNGGAILQQLHPNIDYPMASKKGCHKWQCPCLCQCQICHVITYLYFSPNGTTYNIFISHVGRKIEETVFLQ